MRPFLIIGLGGSGVKIGCALKRILYTYYDDPQTSQQVRDNLQFVFLENDKNEFTRGLEYAGPYFSMNDFQAIKGAKPEEYVKKAGALAASSAASLSHDDKDLLSWFDTQARFQSGLTDTGMGGFRQQGRLASYVNWRAIRTKLSNAITVLQAVQAGQAQGQAQMNVLIISSMCGGTGSSIYLDVAAMVDELYAPAANTKIAALLCPSFFLQVQGDKNAADEIIRRYQMNAWAFMSEAEYFSLVSGTDFAAMARATSRPSMLDTAIKANRTFKPFSCAYLFDHRRSDGGQIEPSSYFTTVATMLAETVAGSNNQQLETVLFNSNAVQNAHRKHRTATALSIEFPASDYREYFETRFLFDFVGRHLLRTKLDASDQANVEKQAKALSKSLAGPILIGAMGVLESAWAERQEATTLEQSATPAVLADAKDPKSLQKDPAAAFNHFETLLIDYRKYLTKDVEAKVGYWNFEKKFSNDNEPADRLRAATWSTVAGIVREYGYYAVVGHTESAEKGFLDHLRAETRLRLAEAEAALAVAEETRQGWDDRRAAFRAQIEKLASSRLVSAKLGDDKVKGAVQAYFDSLQQSASSLRTVAAAEVRRNVLRGFAGALKGNAPGWIDSYRAGLRDAVGPASQRKTLADWFDDGVAGDSASVRSRFEGGLAARFANSAKDVYRFRLPYALCDLVDQGKWLPDGGPGKTNALGTLYAEVVKPGPATFRQVSLDSKQTAGMQLSTGDNLLARFHEGTSEERWERVQLLEKQVREWFVANFLAPTSTLGGFLGKNLIEAYEKWVLIKGPAAQGELQLLVGNMPLPLNFQAGQAANLSRSLYATVDTDAAFLTFAQDVLGINVHAVNAQSFSGSKNRIAILTIVDGVEFSELTDVDKMKLEYVNRSLTNFRPHLVSAWNEKVNGPWDIGGGVAGTIQAQFGSTSHHVEPEEQLLLALAIEGLRLGKKKAARAVAGSLFLSDSKELARNGLLGHGPLAYDESQKRFFLVKGPDSFKLSMKKAEAGPKGTRKAAAQGSEQYAVKAASRSTLDMTFSKPAIESTLNAMTDPGQQKLYEEFFRIVMSNKKAVQEALREKNSDARGLIDEFIGEYNRSVASGKGMDQRDQLFFEGLNERFEKLMDRLFSQKPQ